MILLMALSPTPAVGPYTPVLAVQCDCGVRFAWPSHVSLAQCPGCGRAELWHKVEPRPAEGMWSERVMAKSTSCMACSAPCERACVISNGNMEPWVVCMSCFRKHESGDDECEGT